VRDRFDLPRGGRCAAPEVRLTLTAICTAIVLALGCAVAPAAARAESAVGIQGEFHDRVTGTSGPVSGALYLADFSADGRALVATGFAAIGLCVPGVDPKNCAASYDCAVATTVTAISGICDAIVLELDPIEGFVGARFDVVVQAVTPLVGNGDQRRPQCTIARQAQTSKPLFTFAPLLDRLGEAPAAG
jgi:hypothetical protein